jgi:hypothetical protein
VREPGLAQALETPGHTVDVIAISIRVDRSREEYVLFPWSKKRYWKEDRKNIHSN